MVRLFRMYRLLSKVAETLKEENTDNIFLGLNEGHTAYATGKKCLDMYKPWGRNKEYIKFRTMKSAIKSGYITQHGQKLEMEEAGWNLIEGYGYGFLRELATKEWKALLVFAFIIGLIANPLSEDIRRFIMGN